MTEASARIPQQRRDPSVAPTTARRPRVVIVHDYLTQRGGAERVVLSMLKAFPGARLVTSVYEPDTTFPEFADHHVETSVVNKLSAVRHDARVGLPLFAPAWSSRHVNDADVVLCSSSGWAHGVQTSAYKIVYCHNPARWLYQREEYMDGAGAMARTALTTLSRPLKRWDRRQAATADLYLANSQVVQQRIRETYGIDSDVVHPPASIDAYAAQELVSGVTPGFVLTIGRSRGYKNTRAVIEAIARRPEWSLVVLGEEHDPSWPSNVTGLTDVSDAQLRWLYANCRALVAVGCEDFGLTVPEVCSFGKPVVAWRSGGYLETVSPGVNGYLIDAPTPVDIVRGLDLLSRQMPSTAAILGHAEQFGEKAFAQRLRAIVAGVGAVHPSTPSHLRLAHRG